MIRWLVFVAMAATQPALAQDDEPDEPAGEDSTKSDDDGAPAGWTEIPLAPVGGEAPRIRVVPPPEPAPEGPPDLSSDNEITVWGTAAVREARSAVVRRFEELGWEQRRRNAAGDIVFRGPEPWMGSARLSDDGLIAFKRRLVWLDPVREIEGPPPEGMGALDRSGSYAQSEGVATQGGLRGPASGKKIDGARAELLRGVDAQMDHYRSTLAETALRQRLEVLPDRLDRLWRDGTPLASGPYLADAAARRAAVLDYWATRPDTREGGLVCDAVENWLDEVVQTSETPATLAELDAAAARRGAGWYPLPDRP